MKVRNLMPKSRLTFSVSIIILLAVFFIGYYFYYIPTNKEDLYKNGFLILKNIKTSILERNEDFQKLYKTYFDKNAGGDVQNMQQLLDTNKVSGKVISYDFDSVKTLDHLFDSLSTAGTKLPATVINQNNLIYLHANMGILVPAENILKPIFQSQKTELFESYLLIDKKTGLYRDPELSIIRNIAVDSLLSGSNAMFANVRDIRIEDISYKMFFYPFIFGNDDIVLCGFIKTKKYNTRLHEIPVSFIYPIVIVFLLLLIFLPIIKFYLIGVDESIKFIDVTLSVLSFILGPALITLILIQVLLLWSADLRARHNLELLSKQIDSSFNKDILGTYRQLDVLDSFITSGKDTVPMNVSKQVIGYFNSHKGDTSLYYNFDRIFWVDFTGKPTNQGQLENTEPLFPNVSARKYFQVFKNDKPYILPGSRDLFFGFEPVTSWIDGEFRIVISKKSRLKNGFIVALATQMPSVIQTILPPGFGFCIIDDTGNVQLHSDMNRNLEENIIEKMSPSRPAREAIISRQAAYFNNLKFYGKTNAANITSISQLPLFLVTFYDKGYIVPIAMRIFTFALLFCFFSFFVCLLIWLLVFGKRYYANPILYSPMMFLKWAIPRADLSDFYVLGKRFLRGYILVLLLFMAFSVSLNISNYVVLVLVLLIPVNVICGLFVISYATTKHDEDKKEKIEQHSKKAVRAIIFQLFCSLVVYFYSFSQYRIELEFLIFQVIFNAVLWVYYSSSSKLLFVLSKDRRSYLSRYFILKKISFFFLRERKYYLAQYAGLATALIICLAVLPAGLYTWYAHNQEITQSVKKGQLYLAESLHKRKPFAVKSTIKRDSLYLPTDYYEKLQYQSGIYKIYRDSIKWKPGLSGDTLAKNKNSYEQFYFSIANDIGNNYYDPLLLPALKDRSSDTAWYWSRYGKTLSFWFTFPDMFSSDDSKPSSKPIYINSHFPERYLFVGFSIRGVLLFIIVVLLIRGLYRLVSSLTERIFLEKFIVTIENKKLPENRIKHLLEDFNKVNESPYPAFNNDIKNLKKEYDYYKPGDNNKEIYEQEKNMIDAIKKYKSFYDFIWQKCTEKERYLLLDFARDNLVNFKNNAEIYNLLEKGILITDGEIRLFSPSFRAYLITKNNTPEIYLLQKKFQQNSTWQSFRIPLLVILLGIALFIFFTQQETSQKLTAMVAGISSLLSLLLKFFSDSGAAPASKK